MGDKISLKLDARDVHGKKVAQLRKEGLTPGVVYGPGMDPVSVQAAAGEVMKTVREAGRNIPVHLTVGAKKRIAMIKDVDYDPVKANIRHVSFHAVKANEPVEAEVPIRLIGSGESEAEKAGLVILQTIESVEVRALPMDLPEALEVSIAGLKEAGEKVLVGDVTLPENVELVDKVHAETDDEDEEAHSIKDLVVASVYEPSALQAANEAAGGDADENAEPEAEKGSEEAGKSGDESQNPAEKDKKE